MTSDFVPKLIIRVCVQRSLSEVEICVSLNPNGLPCLWNTFSAGEGCCKAAVKCTRAADHTTALRSGPITAPFCSPIPRSAYPCPPPTMFHPLYGFTCSGGSLSICLPAGTPASRTARACFVAALQQLVLAEPTFHSRTHINKWGSPLGLDWNLYQLSVITMQSSFIAVLLVPELFLIK